MMSEKIDQLAEALSQAQGQMPPIPKEKIAKIKTKDGGSYTYRFADLPVILEAVRKPLLAHKLSITQILDEGKLTTLLMHASGQYLKSTVILVRDATMKMQDYGAQITYLRRYVLTALLGICADEDADAPKENEDNLIVAESRVPIMKLIASASEIKALEEAIVRTGDPDLRRNMLNFHTKDLPSPDSFAGAPKEIVATLMNWIKANGSINP